MTTIVQPIDPHVHLRGSEHPRDYLGLGFADAKAVGLCGLIEMPNPTPNLVDADTINSRFEKTHPLRRSNNIYCGIHVGLTAIEDQVIAALDLIQRGVYGLKSDKVFYTHSTGNMGITDPSFQKWIWRKKAETGYRGVSLGHFEDEREFTGHYTPDNPVTHSWRQNPEAEYLQVEAQLETAFDVKFRGTFYAAHVSNPATLHLLNSRRTIGKFGWGFQVIAEATWHHLLLNYRDYELQKNRVKMNPPLRSQRMQESLLNMALNGHIDVIGSDHAPHPVNQKDGGTPPPSGIPALPFWVKGIEILRGYGIDEDLLEDITFGNANRIFNLDLPHREIKVEYDPSRWDKYGWNPFSRVDGTLLR